MHPADHTRRCAPGRQAARRALPALAALLALALLFALARPAPADGPQAAQASGREPLVIVTHPDYPPMMYVRDGVLLGVGPDLAHLVLDDLGLPWRDGGGMSWGRALFEADAGRADLVVGLYRNAERQERYDFVPTPFLASPETLIGMKGVHWYPGTWDGLRGRRVGLIRHERFSHKFEQFLKDNAATVDVTTVPSLEAALAMLQAGRIDCFPFGLYSTLAKAQSMGLGGRVAPLGEPLSEEPLYFAVSRRSPWRDLLPELDRRIRARIADGTVDRLLDEHLARMPVP